MTFLVPQSVSNCRSDEKQPSTWFTVLWEMSHKAMYGRLHRKNRKEFNWTSKKSKSKTKYKMVSLEDFNIIGKRQKKSKFQCKLTDSLHIK